jgi:hypothetical protein
MMGERVLESIAEASEISKQFQFRLGTNLLRGSHAVHLGTTEPRLAEPETGTLGQPGGRTITVKNRNSPDSCR